MARSDQTPRRALRGSWLRRHFGMALAIEAVVLAVAVLVIARSYVAAGIVAGVLLLLLIPVKGMRRKADGSRRTMASLLEFSGRGIPEG